MRWAQLTLVENDPGRFDPQFWLDYFRRLHADAATLSAGGIVAYYPTEVPLHHRSAWLGDSDPFGALVKGCRDQGMLVVARTDPHAVRDEVRAAHPDWISTTRDGKPLRHWANPDLWVSCALGPYNFELMDQVHREIVSKYKVDGIFARCGITHDRISNVAKLLLDVTANNPVVFDHSTRDGMVKLTVTLPACANFRIGNDKILANGHLYRTDTMRYELIKNAKGGELMIVHVRPNGPARFVIEQGGTNGIAWFETP